MRFLEASLTSFLQGRFENVWGYVSSADLIQPYVGREPEAVEDLIGFQWRTYTLLLGFSVWGGGFRVHGR